MEEAHRLFSADSLIFIDARNEQVFKREHLPEALSLPYSYKGVRWNKVAFIKEIRSNIIVTYCDSKICNLSYGLALFLSEEVNSDVYYLHGGIEAWVAAGYPVYSDF